MMRQWSNIQVPQQHYAPAAASRVEDVTEAAVEDSATDHIRETSAAISDALRDVPDERFQVSINECVPCCSAAVV